MLWGGEGSCWLKLLKEEAALCSGTGRGQPGQREESKVFQSGCVGRSMGRQDPEPERGGGGGPEPAGRQKSPVRRFHAVPVVDEGP